MDPSALALQAVGGFTVGALIGYALRKVTKWLLLAIGFLLLPIFGLWYMGAISVDWAGINALIGRLMEWIGVNLSNATTALASAGTFGVSTLLGFLFGVTAGFRHTVADIAYRKRYVRRKEVR